MTKLKNLKYDRMVYPAISLLFLFLMLGLFAWAVRFLSVQINKPFSITSKTLEAGLLKVDMETYGRVSKKFAITAFEQATTTGQIPATGVAGNDFASTTAGLLPPPATAFATSTLTSKLDLKIAIYNASGKAGLAKDLTNSLNAAGYLVSTTGNNPQAQGQTTISTKGYLSAYSSWVTEIKLLVSAKYNLGASATLSDSQPFDIVIVIGKK